MYETKAAEQRAGNAGRPMETLIAEIAAGDKAALSSLYQETKVAVFGFALSILKNSVDAEDVLQDTYMKIWSSAEGYRSQGKPMAWILTIAKNLSFSILRERRKTTDLPDDDWSMLQTEGPAVRTEDRMVLNAAMGLLSDEDRNIVILHAVSGLKHAEIARLLSLPLSTVLSKYSRARKKLQNALKGGTLI